MILNLLLYLKSKETMKDVNLILILILIALYSNSQNLVPNPSFEDTLWCPLNHGQINASSHWFSPIGGGSSEFFHECNNYPHPPWSTGIVGVPDNSFGYQYSRTGNAYAGFIFYDYTTSLEYRENIEVQLINVLNPNRTYYAEFYVSLCNISAYGIKNVGAYFSTNMLNYPGNHTAMMSLTPHIEYSGSPIIDTLNWVKVSGYFKPDDEGTKYMTIGNFANQGQTAYQKIHNGYYTYAYYYVDDVFVADSVSYVNSLKEHFGFAQFPKINVYPNPASDKLNIEYQESKQSSFKKIEIFNCMGDLVKVEYFKQNESCVDVSDLPQGFYIVAVQSRGKILTRQKIVISR